MKYLIDLIVVGTGSPDIIRLIEDINSTKKIYNFLGFLDTNIELHGEKYFGYPIIGDDDLLSSDFKNCAVINNVMKTPKLHENLSISLRNKYLITNFPNLIHPSINIKHVEFGIGNIVYEGAYLGVGVVIGDFNIIYYGATVGHETIIGNMNLIAGNTLIGARSKIGNRIVVGNAAVIKLGLKISDDSFIGMGSVVINSIRKPQTMFGNPAIRIDNDL